jgi:competence protein ComEC
MRNNSRCPTLVTRLVTRWVDREAGRFILFLPVCMATGVLVYFAQGREPPASLGVVMAAILLPASAAARAWPLLRAILLAAGVAACGFASAQWASVRAPPWAALPRGAVVVSGVVTALEALPEGRRVVIGAPALDDGPALPRALRIRLQARDLAVLEPGDRINVRALLRAPSPPAYPGAWDTQRDAYFAGLAGYGFAIGKVAVLAAAPGGGWRALRSGIAARIMAVLPGPRGAIAATLLTGMGTAIPAADRAAFQDSGLAHLLAVAGLHIGIVMGLVFAAMRGSLLLSERAALFWPVKQIAAVAALAAGLGYLALTGAHVPILRSFIMASLVTLALITGRRAVSMRALALAAVVLMAAAPDLVMGVSFQMSFAAVLALVAGWEALAPVMALLQETERWWRGPARQVAALVVTSALAGTASLPVAAYHFGSATTYYVPANMVAVPVTAFWVMPWGLAALALMPLGLQGLALTPMGWGISVLLGVAHAVSGWPAARLAVPQLPPASLVAFMAGLIWLCVWRTRLRLAGLAVMAAGLVIAMLAPLPDLVVSPDARLIAARVGGHVYVAAARGTSRFDKAAPGRVWGVAATLAFPAAGALEDGAVICTEGACRVTARGQVAVVVRTVGTPCRGADLIVASVVMACPGAAVVDRGMVARLGATSVRLTAAGAVIRTDADERGVRPWVIRGLGEAESVRLPPALTE